MADQSTVNAIARALADLIEGHEDAPVDEYEDLRDEYTSTYRSELVPEAEHEGLDDENVAPEAEYDTAFGDSNDPSVNSVSIPAGATPVPGTPFYVRPSHKQSDVAVIGMAHNGRALRIALVRDAGGGVVRLRTLDGNPRERSSSENTQQVVLISRDALTNDA